MPSHERRYQGLLERLLQIDVRTMEQALDEAATAIAREFDAEKVDAFLLEGQQLHARGTSRTELGRIQHEMGLDILPLANGGRTVDVFQTGRDHVDGNAEKDPQELEGIKRMGVRSTLATPIVVGDETRGVLQVASTKPDAFDDVDVELLRAVARWVGLLAHRVELQTIATRAAVEEGRRLAAEELVTVLAHDLGNYLTPLRARLELNLRDARRDRREVGARRLEAAIENVDQVMRLTADLLDVSRIEEGLLRLQPTVVELRPLASEVARTLASERTNVHVGVPEDFSVKADLLRLRQILVNLVGNSVKHSPKGGTVTISAERDSDAAIIRVSDEGPGVPTDIMPRVFMRYARGPRSTGLGIGLYLAERIAAAHGGSLTLESSPSGATFTLRLPS